jgi:hypothetical protein
MEEDLNPVINEFATMNLVVIWLVVLVGFVFVKVVKKRFED